MNTRCLMILIGSSILAAAACDSKAPPTKAASSQPAKAGADQAALPAGLFLSAPPQGATGVKAARAAAKAGDTVVLKGRIGGSDSPFVANRAVFTLMDLELPSCNMNPGDKCTTPWDYCCEPADVIAANAATVRIAGPQGAPLKASLQGVHGLEPLAEVVVVGKASQGQEAGTLVVDAEGIYIAAK